MPAKADDEVRLRVWLAILAPVVAIALIGAYFLTADEKPAAKRAAPIAVEVDPPAPEAVAPPTSPQRLPAPPPSASAALPSPAGALPTAPAPSSSSSSDERREIDALLARPPDSGQWTLEKKRAYWGQLVEELRVRERNLEGDMAAARRSGDTATEQSKAATLDYVRRRREVLESLIRAPAGSDAEP